MPSACQADDPPTALLGRTGVVERRLSAPLLSRLGRATPLYSPVLRRGVTANRPRIARPPRTSAIHERSVAACNPARCQRGALPACSPGPRSLPPSAATVRRPHALSRRAEARGRARAPPRGAEATHASADGLGGAVSQPRAVRGAAQPVPVPRGRAEPAEVGARAHAAVHERDTQRARRVCAVLSGCGAHALEAAALAGARVQRPYGAPAGC